MRVSAPPPGWSLQDFEELFSRHGSLDSVVPAGEGFEVMASEKPEALPRKVAILVLAHQEGLPRKSAAAIAGVDEKTVDAAAFTPGALLCC